MPAPGRMASASACRCIERPEPGFREAIFDRIDLEIPDWHKSWHTDWKAIRETATLVRTKALVARGRAEIAQTFRFPRRQGHRHLPPRLATTAWR